MTNLFKILYTVFYQNQSRSIEDITKTFGLTFLDTAYKAYGALKAAVTKRRDGMKSLWHSRWKHLKIGGGADRHNFLFPTFHFFSPYFNLRFQFILLHVFFPEFAFSHSSFVLVPGSLSILSSLEYFWNYERRQVCNNELFRFFCALQQRYFALRSMRWSSSAALLTST